MIHTGDCVTVMAGMPADSVDAVVTDPPYALTTVGMMQMKLNPSRKDYGPNAPRKSGGFMGRTWDSPSDGTPQGFQAWCEAWGREALRVTKPGGYLLAFGGTRTHHRLVCGLEDAGWIIRDELTWVYASGFPKGRANLKPAHEPIVLARKPGPLRPLNIEETRIGYTSEADRPTQEEWNRAGSSGKPGANGYAGQFSKGMKDAYAEGKIPVPSGRWPSNLLLSDPELFDEPNPYVVGSGATSNGDSPNRIPRTKHPEDFGWSGPAAQTVNTAGFEDGGGYSRFFIIPKADRADREPIVRGQLPEAVVNITEGHGRGPVNTSKGDGTGVRVNNPRSNQHPTVKPTDLMRHLVRLVTPIGGTVLDCFAGSGSTLIAAELEGFPWVGIEKEPEYVAIAEARLNGVQRGLGLDIGAPVKKRTLGEGTYPKGAPYSQNEIFGPLKPDEEPAA